VFYPRGVKKYDVAGLGYDLGTWRDRVITYCLLIENEIHTLNQPYQKYKSENLSLISKL
jgi:hypothetical protein